MMEQWRERRRGKRVFKSHSLSSHKHYWMSCPLKTAIRVFMRRYDFLWTLELLFWSLTLCMPDPKFSWVSLCPSQHHQSALPVIRHPALLIIFLLPQASNHRCPEPCNLYSICQPPTHTTASTVKNNTIEILQNNLKTSQVLWFHNGYLNLMCFFLPKYAYFLLHSLIFRLQMILYFSENLCGPLPLQCSYSTLALIYFSPVL